MKRSPLFSVGLIVPLLLLPITWPANGADRRKPPAQPHSSPRYVVTPIPVPPGFDFFQPRVINNHGDVVGHLDASSGPSADSPKAAFYTRGRTINLHALVDSDPSSGSLAVDLAEDGRLLFRIQAATDRYFIYQRGRVREFSQWLGRSDLTPLGLNRFGQIVGVAGPKTDESGVAFLYSRGAVLGLGTLEGYQFSYAQRITDRGNIVGWAEESLEDNAEHRAVIFTLQGPVDLGVPFSAGRDINDQGEVLGWTSRGLGTNFVWRAGQLELLPFSATALNNDGDVVGFTGPHWPPRAVLRSDGVTADLNDLIDPRWGWELRWAFDINDRGAIAGVGHYRGHPTGFVLTPLPGRRGR